MASSDDINSTLQNIARQISQQNSLITSGGGVPSSILFVDNMGAVGDGVACDDAVFQSAHDQLDAAGGGVVFMGAKTYGICTGLKWGNKVQLVGCGRDASVLKALAAIPVIIWNKLDPITAGTFREFRIDGNSGLATAGIVIGTAQNNVLFQIEIRNCVDGLVLVTTQNMTAISVFVSDCNVNLRWCGLVWNNRFISCGLNAPGFVSILSVVDQNYFDLLGLTNDGTLNRHNSVYHSVIERTTDTLQNIIRLSDGGDSGDNLFFGNEIQGDCNGSSQIYLGASSSNNRILYGTIAKGGMTSGFAFENFGFMNIAQGVTGIGWTTTSWVLNHPGGKFLNLECAGGDILDLGFLEAYQSNYGFISGALNYFLGGEFGFASEGFDGLNVGSPVMTCGGNVVPSNDNVVLLGNSVRQWKEVNSVFVNASDTVSGDLLQTAFGTVASLPGPTRGLRRMVTDATSNTFGAAPGGSGAFIVPVYADGVQWLIG